MSYSKLYVADQNGDMEPDLEQRNGSGSGTVIWSALIWKYEREIWPDYALMPPYQSHNYQALFDSWKKLSLKPWERDVLLMTYDYALVAPTRYLEMAASMRQFSEALSRPGEVEHLTKWADRLTELAATPGQTLGAGLYLTSVGDNWWAEAHDDDHPDTDNDVYYRPYNIVKDDKHFWVEP